MSKSVVTPIRYLLTKNRIAQELEIDRKRVSRLLSSIPPDGVVDGRYNGWYLSTACPVVYGLVGGDEEETIVDPERMQPKDRKDWYDGTKTKLNLDRDAYQLIPVDEMRREMAVIVTGILQVFETLPDILERDCAAPPDQVIKAQEAVDKVRRLAYEAVGNSSGT